MRCTLPPQSTGHDRLRFDLMRAGLQMWQSREQRDAFPQARDRLVDFCEIRLLTHLESDERWLLEARHCPQGHLLAEAMRAEMRMTMAAVAELATATGPCEAMAQTRVLHALLAAHIHHEQLLRDSAEAA